MPATFALTPADIPAYAAIRREMLEDAPWAFGSSPADDERCQPAALRESLAQPERAIFICRDESAATARLLAAAGVMREPKLKRRHIAGIWGVYVTPAARGRGLGRAVMLAAIEQARSWPGVAAAQLSVSQNAPAARRLYESLGFIAWGIEPDALRTADAPARGIAEVHMHLPLV